MTGTIIEEDTTEPPATGLRGELRLRPRHPAFEAGPDADPQTVRLLFLLRMHAGLVDCRAEDVGGLDAPSKQRLIEQIDAALGLNAPTPAVISGHS